jgi:transposase
MSRRQAAGQFGVGVSTVIAWIRLFRKTGSVAPGKKAFTSQECANYFKNAGYAPI